MSPKKQLENVGELERGDIYFLYRPRVEEESPQSREDIQNLYMILSPHEEKTYRMAIIGRERMPQPERRGRQRYWGFVEAVKANAEAVADEMSAKTYSTKTRGERRQPSARPAGEGIYAILRHNDHTHLVYALELPDRPGDVQQSLNIETEASYVISIKNPDKPSPPRAGLPEQAKAEYPPRLEKLFADRKFVDADPPDFLDYEGAEFVLIAAAEDVKAELGIDLNPQAEDSSSAEIFSELHLHRSEHPVKPLFKGEWA